MTVSEALELTIAHRDRYNTSLTTAACAMDIHAQQLPEADYWLLQDALCFLASLEVTDELARAAA